MVNTILIATVVVLVVIVLMLAVAFKQLLKEYLELYSRVLDLQVDEFIMHLQVPASTEEYGRFADEFVSPPHTGKTNCPCWECEESRIEGPICSENEGCGCNDCRDQRKLEKFYAEGGCTNNIHNCECLECKDKRMFAGLDMVE